MLSYTVSQLVGLGSAIQHAESQRGYWLDATGSDEYFVASMADGVGLLMQSLQRMTVDDPSFSNTYTLAIVTFNSM